jgi:hypothetical protein
MAIPWLFFTGFNIMMSSLFAKLWRLNKIFHIGRYRRVSVRAADAFTAFGFVFGINIVALVIWTLVDPLDWEIKHVPGEEWNRFGSCSGLDTAGKVMFGLTFALSAAMLCLTAYQAIKARKISDEYSESKQLGFAVFTTLQIIIVAVPILFLISDENPDAKYLLQTLIIFAVCMSVMLVVFVPIIFQYHRQLHESGRTSSVGISGMMEPYGSRMLNSQGTSYDGFQKNDDLSGPMQTNDPASNRNDNSEDDKILCPLGENGIVSPGYGHRDHSDDDETHSEQDSSAASYPEECDDQVYDA